MTVKQIRRLLRDLPDDMEVMIQVTDEEYNVLTATVDTYEIEDDVILQGESV